MPKWRKLHVKARESLDIDDMPDDFHRLLWVLLPLGLCRQGRGLDNPSWVKSTIMPLRMDVTYDDVSAALDWYAARGMIERYEVNGRHYFMVPSFRLYQGNTEKEAASEYPPPPHAAVTPEQVETEDVTNSGPTLELVPTSAGPSIPLDVDVDVDVDSDTNAADAPSTPPPEPSPNPPPKKKQAKAPKPPPPPSLLLPDTDASRLLFGQLQQEASAKGRRGPKRFPSLACKRKFDEAAVRLGNGDELKAAITRAMQKGCTSVVKATDFVAKWRTNGPPKRLRISGGDGRGEPSDGDILPGVTNAEMEAKLEGLKRGGGARASPDMGM